MNDLRLTDAQADEVIALQELVPYHPPDENENNFLPSNMVDFLVEQQIVSCKQTRLQLSINAAVPGKCKLSPSQLDVIVEATQL